MNISILGDGGWGTALAVLLNRHGHDVTVWGPFDDYLAEVRQTHMNRKFLPGVELPETLAWTADPETAAREAQLVVLAAPSRYFAGVAEQFTGAIGKDVPVVSVSKGLSPDGAQRLTELASARLHHPPVAALSGPSHAEEVARGIPSAAVVACADETILADLQQAFNGPTFRVYSSHDIVGVELGGALKNVIAVAAGVSDGIGFGDNTKAALITRGLAEMARLGTAAGAHPDTFSGLSGMGDLVVTCFSRHSRNRAVGERLGKGETAEAILAGMEQVAEGVQTCAAAQRLARSLDIEVPIIDEVHAILHEGKDPRKAVQDLLARDPKAERG